MVKKKKRKRKIHPAYKLWNEGYFAKAESPEQIAKMAYNKGRADVRKRRKAAKKRKKR